MIMIMVRICREYVCCSLLGLRNSNSNNLSSSFSVQQIRPEPIRLKIHPIFRYSLIKTIEECNNREIIVFPESLLLQIHLMLSIMLLFNFQIHERNFKILRDLFLYNILLSSIKFFSFKQLLEKFKITYRQYSIKNYHSYFFVI